MKKKNFPTIFAGYVRISPKFLWGLVFFAVILLLAVPGCILSLWQNALIDRQGQEAHRAEALSAFHMASSLFELVVLTGSSAIAALGPAACFGAVGVVLAALGAAARRGEE